MGIFSWGYFVYNRNNF